MLNTNYFVFVYKYIKYMKVLILIKIFETSSPLKKLKINKVLIEKFKDMLENPDYEQHYYSRTAMGI